MPHTYVYAHVSADENLFKRGHIFERDRAFFFLVIRRTYIPVYETKP